MQTRARSKRARTQSTRAAFTGEFQKTLVVDEKWLAALAAVQGGLEHVSQTLTGRIRQLAERYAVPLPHLLDEIDALAQKVNEHLKRTGFESFN